MIVSKFVMLVYYWSWTLSFLSDKVGPMLFYTWKETKDFFLSENKTRVPCVPFDQYLNYRLNEMHLCSSLSMLKQ